MFDVQDDEEGPDVADVREAASSEFKLDEKGRRAVEYIKANIAISGFAELITEELWLREILKDVDSTNPFCRTRALSMLAKYLNIGGKGNKKDVKVDVEFEG